MALAIHGHQHPSSVFGKARFVVCMGLEGDSSAGLNHLEERVREPIIWMFVIYSIHDYIRCAGIDSVVTGYWNYLTATEVSSSILSRTISRSYALLSIQYLFWFAPANGPVAHFPDAVGFGSLPSHRHVLWTLNMAVTAFVERAQAIHYSNLHTIRIKFKK